MPSNDGYIKVVIAMMQKYFDPAISGNWSYNPYSLITTKCHSQLWFQDMLTAYKYGWKIIHQNTYDFKGEEEDVQSPGVDVEEHYEINGHVNGEAPLNGKLNGQRVNGEATSEPTKNRR